MFHLQDMHSIACFRVSCSEKRDVLPALGTRNFESAPKLRFWQAKAVRVEQAGVELAAARSGEGSEEAPGNIGTEIRGTLKLLTDWA
jgi:hypothetical protein